MKFSTEISGNVVCVCECVSVTYASIQDANSTPRSGRYIEKKKNAFSPCTYKYFNKTVKLLSSDTH